MRDPTFTRHDNDVTVDFFPAEMMVTRQFLKHAHPEFVRRTGLRRFTIVCANAVATYRLQSREPHKVFVCRRLA